MKRIFAMSLVLITLVVLPFPVQAEELTVAGKSSLLMDVATGTVLHEQNSHEKLAPASVTKIMTMLLIMEAVDSGKISMSDMVTASETAAAKGGSQIFLKAGETMPVSDMLKSIAVSSANDCACAMAEHIAGSEEAFVARMNERAAELGMQDTHFCNATGLPAQGHVTSAHDIALMSRELILNHPKIREYTTIWMDTLRNGQSQLVNTNKLIRFYEGATGLKTGSTDAARYCLSGTAEREGMELVAVIMKGETSEKRFADAKALLNYGFSTYTLKNVTPQTPLAPIPVELGTQATCQPTVGEGATLLMEKAKAGDLQQSVEIVEGLTAPVAAGDPLGTLTVTSGGETVASIPIVAGETVERLTFGQVFGKLLKMALMAG